MSGTKGDESWSFDLVSCVVCPVLWWNEEGRTVNILDMHKDLRFVLVMHHVFIASFVLCSKCGIRKSKQCLPDCLFYVFLIVLVFFSLTFTKNTSVTRDVRVSADHATFPTSKRFWSRRWLQLACTWPNCGQCQFKNLFSLGLVLVFA